MSRWLFLLLATATLAACSSHSDLPGTVTADDARQLNDAAAMLDANSMDGNTFAPDDNESDSQ